MSVMAAPLKERIPGYARTSRNMFVMPGKNSRARIDKPDHKLVRFGETCLHAARQYRDGELGMKAAWKSYRDWYLGGGNFGSLTYQNMIFETIEERTHHARRNAVLGLLDKIYAFKGGQVGRDGKSKQPERSVRRHPRQRAPRDRRGRRRAAIPGESAPRSIAPRRPRDQPRSP